MSLTTLTPSHPVATATPSPRPGLFLVLRLWWQRAETRADLAEAPDAVLRDIGIDRMTARQEASKHFWEA